MIDSTPPNRFAMMKSFVGGELHNYREVFQYGLTFAECYDTDRFPLGLQDDDARGQYVFMHIAEDFV